MDGFYAWRHEEKQKVPYYITLMDQKPFALGGLYSVRKNRPTFSIVPTNANPLIEYIHNTKKRMPLSLSREEERRWLDPELIKAEIKALMQPFDDGQTKAKVMT
ncbi:SOS response-associated peptidase [Larkinella sp. GY13]|uniref:SOS response-associated peptidase n=1 Tax=Larkinella sp. GY13 TaxID=3453720 RepID=UPI003EE8F46B